jgi:hypothetical protein
VIRAMADDKSDEKLTPSDISVTEVGVFIKDR